MKKFLWGELEVRHLKEMLAEGLTSAQIAAMLQDVKGMHPTRHAVIGKVNREKFAFRHVFKTKPSGRPRKNNVPPPARGVAQHRPRPTFRPEKPDPMLMPRFDGKGVALADHQDFHCRCVLDDGTRCNSTRMVGSSWCQHHRQRFTRPV